jgi:hypothetical protein
MTAPEPTQEAIGAQAPPPADSLEQATRQPGNDNDHRGTTDPAPSGEVVRINDPGEALPALARATAGAWLRAAAWSAGTTLRVGAQAMRAATDPDAAAHVYGEVADGLRNYAREFLGINELDREMRLLTPLAGSRLALNPRVSEESLRAQGSELLRAAADVGVDERAHPAYAQILAEISPDEARILRLLAAEGPQALVDIRAAHLIGIGSQLVAPALNMLGSEAGLARRARVPIYLTNLSRLGLVLLSDEEIEDRAAYQVLEAQPDVLTMIKQTPRARSVHRSLALTPLGLDLCEVCFPAQQRALLAPGHEKGSETT